jgi:PKD repeat protein
VLTFNWDFGDSSTGTGQLVQHIYAASNTYVVTLTVRGEPCPITEPAIVTATVVVGSGVPEKLLYLPLIFKSSSDGTAVSALGRPAQVTGLSGSSQPGAGTTRLAWQPNDAAQALSGYRIYRRSRTTEGAFRLWATVPADVTTYTDHTTACGYAYYVTAFNAAGESLPSTASYFSLPCQD